MAVAQELLDILRCPESRETLIYFRADEEHGECLFCPASRLVYPVVDDLPVMLIEDAVRLEPAAARALEARAGARDAEP